MFLADLAPTTLDRDQCLGVVPTIPHAQGAESALVCSCTLACSWEVVGRGELLRNCWEHC